MATHLSVMEFEVKWGVLPIILKFLVLFLLKIFLLGHLSSLKPLITASYRVLQKLLLFNENVFFTVIARFGCLFLQQVHIFI